ncbi:MAG: hypothetical protein ACI9EF_000517 [Pseudohongiellaceae bacterium]|jgi:hypothetical protein
MTRLVMTLLVRDEVDIVRQNLEFHLQHGVDHVIATDNGSRDGTVEVLEEFAARGLLTLIHEGDDDYAQGRWVTRMARMAQVEQGADWVINNDADEFWWAEQGDLKESLGKLTEESNVVVAERSNFVPLEDDERPFFERMVYRHVRSLNPLGAPLPPKSCHRGHGDVTVHQGNHGLSWDWPLRVEETQPIEIFHFPMRSFGQFENKIRLGGAAYGRNVELPQGIGRTWRLLYEELQQGRLLEHYESQRFDGERLSGGLADGSVVQDRRLCEVLQTIASGALL